MKYVLSFGAVILMVCAGAWTLGLGIGKAEGKPCETFNYGDLVIPGKGFYKDSQFKIIREMTGGYVAQMVSNPNVVVKFICIQGVYHDEY